MRVVIIGGSHAGIACAESLRQNGYDGQIMIIERLAGLPLERPPLSKAFLAADPDNESRFALRSQGWYTEHDITLKTGVEVVAIDTGSRSVSLADGAVLSYDRLVLATGATPRRLGGLDAMSGVYELRHPEDARRIRDAATDATSAVIVGGGYIGLEVAASLTKVGVKVAVFEAADRLLARVASPLISDFFASLHNDAGVNLHIGSNVADFINDKGAFAGVTSADGRTLPADMLVVGIGVTPETGLAEMAGCAVGNGILVGADMATDVDGIYAIGDGALVQTDGTATIGGAGAIGVAAGIRIESVHNAQDSGERAAAAINGHAPPSHQAPWFWSEQYDARLQSAGLVPPPDDDTVFVRRPGKRETGFSVWSIKAGMLCAVEAVRDPAGYMLGKACLERGLSPDAGQLADPAFDLKAFVAG